MTKTYDYDGVIVDLATRRELARLEGKVAEAEGWVRHYTTEIATLADRRELLRLKVRESEGWVLHYTWEKAILADRAIWMEEVADVVRRLREMKCARDDWRMKAEDAKTQIKMLLEG